MKHVPKILKYSTSIPRLNSKFFRFKQHQHQQQRQQHLVNILISQCHIIQVYLINQFMNFGHWYIDCDWIKVKYALYLHNYKRGLLIKPMNNFFFFICLCQNPGCIYMYLFANLEYLEYLNILCIFLFANLWEQTKWWSGIICRTGLSQQYTSRSLEVTETKLSIITN